MVNENRLDEFKSWIGKELFTPTGYNETIFKNKQQIFSIPLSSPLFVETLIHFPNKKPSKYSVKEINELILKENRRYTNQDWAVWFHVPYDDDVYLKIVDVGIYTFGLGTTPALKPIYSLIEHNRADQCGTTYSGILANNKKWCLLLEYQPDKIEMHLYKE